MAVKTSTNKIVSSWIHMACSKCGDATTWCEVSMNGKHGLEPLCARCHSKAKSSKQAVGEPVSPLKKKRQPRYVCLRVHVTCRGRASYLVNRFLEVKLLFAERRFILRR